MPSLESALSKEGANFQFLFYFILFLKKYFWYSKDSAYNHFLFIFYFLSSIFCILLLFFFFHFIFWFSLNLTFFFYIIFVSCSFFILFFILRILVSFFVFFQISNPFFHIFIPFRNLLHLPLPFFWLEVHRYATRDIPSPTNSFRIPAPLSSP